MSKICTKPLCIPFNSDNDLQILHSFEDDTLTKNCHFQHHCLIYSPQPLLHRSHIVGRSVSSSVIISFSLGGQILGQLQFEYAGVENTTSTTNQRFYVV